MLRKKIIPIISIIAIILIGVVFAFLNKGGVKIADTPPGQNAKAAPTQSPKPTEEPKVVEAVENESTEDNVVKIINTQDLKVLNNSLEYDLKASLYENSLKETFLKFEYYNDGANVLKELGATDVPEITGILDSTPERSIKTLYLNIKYSKVYFTVAGNTDQKATAIYSFNLKDFSLKKIFSGEGTFTITGFTKNSKYMAFSYKGIEPQANYLLQVLKCETDGFVINENRDTKGELIESSKMLDTVYGYTFLSWYSNSVAKLGETAVTQNKEKKQKDILYDVEKNTFLNLDGSGIISLDNSPKPDNQQVKAESDVVKVLRSFYLYLSSEQYSKAYDILDDKFQLNAFKMFGVTELSKADIDVNSFSIYGSLFKTAKIESIVGEKNEGDTSTVYFYQTFSIEEGNPIQQPLAATLKKTDKGWKVSAVSDGKINEEPFKQ